MIRFYVMPVAVVLGNRRGPAYLKWPFNPTGIDCRWSLKDYGLINACLIAADITQAQHDELTAHADVAAAPLDIDQNVGAIALPTVKNVLEALRIPAGWVTTSHTYRELLRMVGGLFMFAQRHHSLHGEQLIDTPAQLDLLWNQIPLDRRQRIIATADDLEYNYDAVQSTWTVRHILKYLGERWGETPIIFGNLVTL